MEPRLFQGRNESTAGKVRRISRKSRVSEASPIEIRRRAEANHGAHRTMKEEHPVVALVQALGGAHELEWYGAREQTHRRDALGHLGRADHGIRSAAGPSDDCESVDVEGTGQRGHVIGPVKQPSIRLERRPSHPRTIRRDDAQAPSESGGSMGRGGIEPGAQAAVEAEDGIPGGIPVFLVGQLPPVGHGDADRVTLQADRRSRGAQIRASRQLHGTQARYRVLL